jgi:hypothetical protein
MIYVSASLVYSFLIKQNVMGIEEGQHKLESAASLPVLCIEDGSVILRFSEIFGIQEPSRKAKTDHHKRPVNKGMLNFCKEMSKTTMHYLYYGWILRICMLFS